MSNVLAGKTADGSAPLGIAIPFTNDADARAAAALLILALAVHLDNDIDEHQLTPLTAKLLAHLTKTGRQSAEQISQFPVDTLADAIREDPYLQPLADVNKRVTPLAANIPLLTVGLSPLPFIDVPGDLYLKAMLCIYELNQVDALRDLLLWAYPRSANRYAVVRQTIGEPDPFKLTLVKPSAPLSPRSFADVSARSPPRRLLRCGQAATSISPISLNSCMSLSRSCLLSTPETSPGTQ